MIKAFILIFLFGLACVEGGGWWIWFGLSLVLVWLFTAAEKPVEAERSGLELEGQEAVTGSGTDAKAEWLEKLTDLCAQFEEGDLFVAEHISKGKLKNAQQFYPPPLEGQVVAVLDSTAFGSAKTGLAISCFGLSWCNSLSSQQPGQGAMLWKDFVSMPLIEAERKFEFDLGGGNSFNIAAATFPKNSLHELLVQIQIAFQEFDKKNASEKLKWPKKLALVDINSADLDTLISLPAIGAAEAHQILQHRRDGKHIGSMEELAALVDLRPHHVVRLKTMVLFSDVQSQHNQTQGVSGDFASEMPRKLGRIID